MWKKELKRNTFIIFDKFNHSKKISNEEQTTSMEQDWRNYPDSLKHIQFEKDILFGTG
jgi:hypothetical protein